MGRTLGWNVWCSTILAVHQSLIVYVQRSLSTILYMVSLSSVDNAESIYSSLYRLFSSWLFQVSLESSWNPGYRTAPAMGIGLWLTEMGGFLQHIVNNYRNNSDHKFPVVPYNWIFQILDDYSGPPPCSAIVIIYFLICEYSENIEYKILSFFWYF